MDLIIQSHNLLVYRQIVLVLLDIENYKFVSSFL